ncbi:MAG: 30S ribosomal protein S16 [bacterium]|nr:30S ribosomal protein S16 [bacterium]
MLKIRLQRVGRVHEPSFRLVLTDSKNSTKSGRFKEILGSYDPRKSTDSLDAERIKYWLSQGANPTDTIHNLLVRHKIVNAKKINVSAKSKKVPAVAVKSDTIEPVVEKETV